MKFSDSFVESLKTFLRYMIIAVVPTLIAQIQSGTINWAVIQTVTIIAFLAALLKWAQESDIKIPVVTSFMTLSKVDELKK